MDIVKVSTLFRDGDKVVLVLWSDNYISYCVKLRDREVYCNVTKGDRKTYYIAQAWYSNLGFKVA